MARRKTQGGPRPPAPSPKNGRGGGRKGWGRASGWLVLIVAVYLMLAGAYNAVTPTVDQHNPDEGAHMLYVASVASGHLPVFRAGQGDYENHQPPLYYIVSAPVYLAARGHYSGAESETATWVIHATRDCRWVSAVLGALLIVVTYLTMRTVLPEEPWVALGAAAFVGLLPMNVSLSASVTNDALTDLVIALGLWRLAGLVMAAGTGERRRWLRGASWLGVVLGVGVWTKTSTLLLWPAVALAFYGLARQKIVSGALAGQAAAVALGLGLLIGLPWLARNQALYGDPVAQHIFQTAFVNTAQASDVARYVFGGSFGAYLLGVARWTFASFWGVFDSMRLFWGQDPRGHTPSPAAGLPVIYDVLAVLSLAALAGLVRGTRAGTQGWNARQGVALAAFGLLVVCTGLAHFRFILVFFQAQGRYWYPALVPLALAYVLGVRGWLGSPRRFPIGVGTLALGLLGLNVYTLVALLGPRFAGP